MPEKTIKELIEEAQTRGVNIYDHIAEALWGAVNAETRHSAKQYTFAHMYGGSPNVQNSKCLWLMTEEEIKARAPKEFRQEHMNEPFEQHDPTPVMDFSPAIFRQSEDRMHRIVPFKVEVFNDSGFLGTIYTVHATSALDARCMAFVLDGGCAAGLTCFDGGHIELAITYTRIVG